MSGKPIGWVMLLASAGMLLGLLSTEFIALESWGKVWTPSFIGTILGHLATVIAAFVSGQILPTHRYFQE